MMQQPDVLTWINAVIRDPDTGRPFDLLPAEIAFLGHAFALNDDESARYPELVYSAPKKSGKTGFAAILTLVATLLYGGRNPEAICVANDLEQSQSRVFAAIRRIVQASPALRDRARITKAEITFPDLGATITAIASDAAGAAGANPVIAVGDELWGFTSEASRRLWDELVPPPTRTAAWRLVVTYAGFSGESTLLEELYRHGTAQPEIAPDLYAGNGQLTFWTHRPVAPWQTDAWLSQMRRSLRPNQFSRMIENRWVTSESAFIDLAAWDGCTDPGLQPAQPDGGLQVFVGVDASLKRDSTAIVAVTTDGERVRLVHHRVFQPSPDAPLDFEATIEAEIVDLCSRFAVQEIRYDPWQMAATSQRLMKRGAPMVEWPQTVSNLTDASSNLFELIQNNSLVVYSDADMRLSISRAIAVETARGWRIAKEKASHKIDTVVALGMACHAAIKQKPIAGWGVLEFYRRQSDAATKMSVAAKADLIRVVWLPDQHQTHLEIAGVSYSATIEGNERVFYLDREHARFLLKGPLPRADLIAANSEVAAGLEPLPREPVGTSVVGMLEAMHPRSLREYTQEVHANRGYETRRTLDMLRAGAWR